MGMVKGPFEFWPTVVLDLAGNFRGCVALWGHGHFFFVCYSLVSSRLGLFAVNLGLLFRF